MIQPIVCAQCGQNNESDAVFCAGCGRPLISQPIKALSVTVGRGADNMIVLTQSNASTHHAIFKINGGNVTMEDVGSSNGTFVNGAKVMLARVTEKDRIEFGRGGQFQWKELKQFLAGAPNYSPDVPERGSVSESLSSRSAITIGRGDDNDIVIHNVKVSRHHARLIKSDGGWVVEDLGSGNGTFVNGKRVVNCPVKQTDAVLIGGVPLAIGNLLKGDAAIVGDIDLSAEHLTFATDGKTIVDDLSVALRSGEFVGLIGPSGAGKTTLMMMMNGVIKPTDGDVKINKTSLLENFNSFKGQIGYVPQDDIIHRELNVEESLGFTAQLRLGKELPACDVAAQVDTVIDALNLGPTRKTLIGSAEKKGISGGQRKKVNLGQELLTEPSILFLDEPTSGLDPRSDNEVMELLRGISRKGKIVVLTTHNISIENFEILTHVIVLAPGGKLAYFGPASEAAAYFGVKKPQQIFDALKNKSGAEWKSLFRGSNYYEEFVKKRYDTGERQAKPTAQKNERSGGLHSWSVLTRRYLKIKLRDTVSTLILLLQAPIIAMLIAMVFSKEADKPQALFVLVIAAIWLGCSNAAREVVSEQAIYKRERMVNLQIPSYLFSKLAVLGLLCAMQCMILAGVTSAFLTFNAGVFPLFGVLFLTAMAALMIGLSVSSYVSTSESAMGLIPIVLIPQVILGGLISRFGDMSEAIKVLSGLMISRWSYEAILCSEYSSSNRAVIESIGFTADHIAIDMAMLGVFIIVFYGVIVGVLKRKDV